MNDELTWCSEGPPAEPGQAVVVGMGAIGASIAAALVNAGWQVTGLDLDSDGREPGIEPDSEGGHSVATADLVILASPLNATLNWLPRVMAAANPTALVMDVAGAKRAFVRQWAAHSHAATDPLVIGAHPMAGTHVQGIRGARADLLDGAIWVLSPVGSERDDDAVARASAIVRTLAGRAALASAELHDQYAARVSHLPFLNGLALLAITSTGAAQIGGPGFRGSTRVAGSGSVEMWTQVLASNADEVARAVDEMMVALQELRGVVHDPGKMTSVIRAIRMAASQHSDTPTT